MKKDEVKKLALAMARANRHPDPDTYANRVANFWMGIEEPMPDLPPEDQGEQKEE